MNRDVVVIGAGHNGIVAAFYLAKAGLSVEVVEAKPTIGGACKTEELFPGYRFSTCANILAWFRPRVLADTKLLERGLVVEGGLPRSHVLSGGRGFTAWEDDAELRAELGRHSEADSRAWSQWSALWDDARDLLGPYLLSYPPSLGELQKRAEKLGLEAVLETLLTSSIAELGDRYFESEEMRGMIEAPHDVGSLYDHGSAFVQALGAANGMYSETGDPCLKGFVRGGMGRVIELLAEAAEEEGVVFRTNAPVEAIVVEEGRVAGVALADGSQLESKTVISCADVKRTFTKFLAGVEEAGDVAKRVESLRADIAPLKMHLALSGIPEFPAFPGVSVLERSALAIQPSRDYHERAWDDARHGRLPSSPYMNLFMPSAWDETLAPDGRHTMSIWMQFAPVELAESSWEAEREEMADRIVKVVGEYSPGFEQLVVDRFLLTPPDLDERVMLTDGNIHHVDIVPSQMLAQRPCPELARYRAPIDGLYLGAAGQHPFGEVSGGPGHNVAHVVLEDLDLVSEWQEIERVAA
ncbi:MAG TPA: NAD(P)/FAD-dependent oxidoreductase [Solirubrobacterales bacterium]|nr:NAD(P)/FAD-dependent oxidoreductase [Solirubrobacterales bacterium]